MVAELVRFVVHPRTERQMCDSEVPCSLHGLVPVSCRSGCGRGCSRQGAVLLHSSTVCATRLCKQAMHGGLIMTSRARQAGLYLSATLGAAERALSLQRLSAAALAAALALLLWRLARSSRLQRWLG